MVSVALGAFVNEPAIIPISTTPFVIAPASMDPLLDMSELKSLCSFLSHSVKKGLSGADTYSIHSSTSTSAYDDCGALAFRRRNCSSYETHPKFDTLEAVNLITCIYLRYSCALSGHFSSIILMKLIKAEVQV